MFGALAVCEKLEDAEPGSLSHQAHWSVEIKVTGKLVGVRRNCKIKGM